MARSQHLQRRCFQDRYADVVLFLQRLTARVAYAFDLNQDDRKILPRPGLERSQLRTGSGLLVGGNFRVGAPTLSVTSAGSVHVRCDQCAISVR